MYSFRLVALSLLLGVSPAAARDRASNHEHEAQAQAAQPRSRALSHGDIRGHGPSSAPDADRFQHGRRGRHLFGRAVISSGSARGNGREPILGTTGRDNKIAAVGLSLRF
jgi:hypothetical protein